VAAEKGEILIIKVEKEIVENAGIHHSDVLVQSTTSK